MAAHQPGDALSRQSHNRGHCIPSVIGGGELSSSADGVMGLRGDQVSVECADGINELAGDYISANLGSNRAWPLAGVLAPKRSKCIADRARQSDGSLGPACVDGHI
jgi:hypothetical protein